MGELISVEFGKFLPQGTKEKLKEKYKSIISVLTHFPLEHPDLDQIESDLAKVNISVNTRRGGKDAFYLIDFFVDDFHLVLKVSQWTLSQLSYYLLSIKEFQNKITDTVEIKKGGLLKIVLANTLAFSREKIGDRSVTVVVQEFSEAINYVDFTRYIADIRATIPVNLVKLTWKVLHENGFIIDYMPKNFHITFNQERNLYQIEYLDFIYSNDPTIKEEANNLAKKFESFQYDPDLFHPI